MSPEIVSQHYKEEIESNADFFIGAQLGKKMNARGKALQEFCSKLSEGNTPQVLKKVIVLDNKEDVSDISYGEILLCVAAEEDMSACNDAIKAAFTNNSETSILVIGKTIEVATEAKKTIEGEWREALNIYFEAEKPKELRGVLHNMYFGVFSGQIIKPPICVCNGEYGRALNNFVERIVKPGGHVTTVILTSQIPVTLLQREEVQYFVMADMEKDVEELLKKQQVFDEIDAPFKTIKEMDSTDIDMPSHPLKTNIEISPLLQTVKMDYPMKTSIDIAPPFKKTDVEMNLFKKSEYSKDVSKVASEESQFKRRESKRPGIKICCCDTTNWTCSQCCQFTCDFCCYGETAEEGNKRCCWECGDSFEDLEEDTEFENDNHEKKFAS